MTQINATSNTQSVFATFSAHGSPQMALAMLQMDLAKTNKEQAMAGIKEIENEQASKKQIADALNAARDLKEAGTIRGSATQAEYDNMIKGMSEYRDKKWAAVGSLKTFPESHGITPAPYGDLNKAVQIWNTAIDQMQKLKTVNAACDAAGISMPTSSDKDKNQAEWDKVIAQLQTKMDTVGANIQTQMVQLQDFMGQYNSYMQGANTAIATSNQVLTGLAKGQ